MYSRNLGDDIARDFARRLLEISSKETVKTASDAGESLAPEDSPESFLLPPKSNDNNVESTLDSLISEFQQKESTEDTYNEQDEKEKLATQKLVGNKRLKISRAERKILSSLGRVKKSLLKDGDIFSANAVDVTFGQIKSEIVKRNFLEDFTKGLLRKEARKLRRYGKRFEADIIESAIK